MTLDEARELVAATLPADVGLEVAPYAWEDAEAFWVVVLHPPFGEPSSDGGAVLVSKASGELETISALADRDVLESMSPVGDHSEV